MKTKFSMLKRIVLIILIVYAIITFIKQQKVLNNYSAQSESLQTKISEEKDYQDELNAEKNNISSSEYLESVAREKLDMYMPNERVYIDSQN